MKFKKKLPGRSKAYMLWIRTLPCCLTDMLANDNQSVDPHHEPVSGHGTMGGKPCDSRCLPVAHYLHCEMEDCNGGRKKVWSRYGVDPEEEIIRVRQVWVSLGGKIFWEV